MQELERPKRVVIVVAHPDDEVIGAGELLTSLYNVHIIHTTDGSPRNLSDAHRSGFATREDYAAARRSELHCALRLADVPVENAISLGFVDQETIHQLPELCRVLAVELRRLKPDAVLTQPYEGGHPDHDSTAFAVHRCFPHSRRLFEMTSYHLQEGALATGVFLPNGESGIARPGAPYDISKKKRMLACFESQAVVLQYFPPVPEQFRRAPQYDFTQPPHAGELFYERLPWGIKGEAWRKLAAQCP